MVKPIWAVLEDPHFLSTGFFQPVQREYLGRYLSSTPWFREHGQAAPLRHLPPTLGQHSADIFQRILGLSAEQIATLCRDGISGTEARMKKPSPANAAQG